MTIPRKKIPFIFCKKKRERQREKPPLIQGAIVTDPGLRRSMATLGAKFTDFSKQRTLFRSRSQLLYANWFFSQISDAELFEADPNAWRITRWIQDSSVYMNYVLGMEQSYPLQTGRCLRLETTERAKRLKELFEKQNVPLRKIGH